MIFKVFLLGCLFVLNHCAEEPYKLVIHNTDPEAKCLDGSPPALYLHQGGDTTRFLVFFVGGGFCSGVSTQQVLQDCYQRSKNQLGSSTVLQKEIIGPGGYLSTDPTKSKFATWTKVVIMYCDGSQHQGHNNEPTSYKDTKLYFRGSDNTKSHFKWLLNTYKINQAEKVVFTGASAGGIATFTWTNYFRKLMDNPDNVYTISDSSVFANVSLPHTMIHSVDLLGFNLFKVTNVDQKFPIEECNKKYPGLEYKCILVQNLFQFLDTKILFIGSEYDAIGMGIMLAYNCWKRGSSGYTLKDCNQTQMNFIEGYRTEYLNVVNTLVENGHSYWTIGCCQHSYACFADFYNVTSQKVPQMTGSTVAEAIDRFVFKNERVVIIDKDPWPANQPCAF